MTYEISLLIDIESDLALWLVFNKAAKRIQLTVCCSMFYQKAHMYVSGYSKSLYLGHQASKTP